MRVKFDPPREYWIKRFRKEQQIKDEFEKYCSLLYSRMEKTTTSDAEASAGNNKRK
jgi:hypothetical protein